MTEVFNLTTGETRTYSLPIKEALRAAYENSRRNNCPWSYKPVEEYQFVTGKQTCALGDWCGIDK